jgi:hypothetical protein
MERSRSDGNDRRDRNEQYYCDHHQDVAGKTRATTACIQGFVIQGLPYAIRTILHHAILDGRAAPRVKLVRLNRQYKEVRAEARACDDKPDDDYQGYQRNQERFHLVFPLAGCLPACLFFFLYLDRRTFGANSKWSWRWLS